MKSKIIEKIIVGLILSSVCAASAAIIKVNVLEVESKNTKELLLEVRQDVKTLLRNNHEKTYNGN